jgi:glycosyltransferase involved in cell wall biosynthesis
MSRPLVSVLIDTYNYGRFLEEAISSVLEQDFPAADREIIVVDDGSTDSTPEILRKFEPAIRVLRKENGGQASAFNAGIPECRGEIVSFLDADDWWTTDKLSKVVKAMEEDSFIGLLGHGIFTVLPDGSRRKETLRDGFRFQADDLAGAKLFRLRCSFLGTSRMTIRKSLLQHIGPLPESIVIQADEYLYTMSAALRPARILPEALTYYRLHHENRFMTSGGDVEKLRNKQQSLAALVKTLSERLEEVGIAKEVRRAILAYTEACAEQMRLSLDGGWPWETFYTEWRAYRVTHPDAPVSHQIFKSFLLLSTLLTPPKKFYKTQQSLARNEWYRRLRERWLPNPEMQHIRKQGRDRG